MATTYETITAGAQPASQDYIKQMYAADLASQNELLKQNYDQNLAALDTQQQKAQKQTDSDLTRTYVEAQKSAKNYGEIQNAYGLTSGAMAQAKLAQDTTLQQDLTALRGVQLENDAQIERERTLLGKEYASAIAKAQADNDMALAEALYQQAAAEEERLLQLQLESAALFASIGDYSKYKDLYGLTDEEVALLNSKFAAASGGGGVGYSSGGGYSKKKNTGDDDASIKDTLTKNNGSTGNTNTATIAATQPSSGWFYGLPAASSSGYSDYYKNGIK